MKTYEELTAVVGGHIRGDHAFCDVYEIVQLAIRIDEDSLPNQVVPLEPQVLYCVE